MIAFLVSAIRLGMTFLLGSTGETITEKAGHLNLGIPGVMCVGAACGCYAEYMYFTAVGSNVVPVLAVLIPLIAALLGGALTIGYERDQPFRGIAQSKQIRCAAHKQRVTSDIEEVYECAADDLRNPEHEIHHTEKYRDA